MSEPRAPYNVDIKLTQRLQRVATFEASQPAIRTAGVEALTRLVPIAQGDTGQSTRVARFLLGCYNGRYFPFDLTDLRGLDIELHEDCLSVLKMDYAPQREVHHLIENGPAIFESLARRWAPLYAESLTGIATALSRIDLE